ncbi:testis-specific serine/threonine-protein kinase 6 isoform X3 [Halyomorpha halys]|uniref:testis-specific serine/threonine-protein kinase 6 isoform X3 n=1 Tax=Halyomorpha halys TaxID=286706 RepID=UPI0006D4C92D|nr:testis-specific serine/threonine-protein kinase 6 isoform X3 [Halyomorpha halys]
MEQNTSKGTFTVTPSMIETCKTQGVSIIKRLGQGSYGAVFVCKRNHYKGKHMRLALKVTDTKTADPHFVDKFLQREIDILLRIRHPFIIYVYSIAQRRRKYYIYMRYAEQGDLLDFLTKAGRVQESRARIWCTQMACAIEYLHLQHIAHRDIKCENILITAHHNTKLSDFGFATNYTTKNGQPVPLTTYCGTRQYACTEILSSIPYDPEKADMWALGVVLYILVNGHTPFKGNTPKKFKKDAMNVERPQGYSIMDLDETERRQFLVTADRNNLLGGEREIAYKPPVFHSYISTGIQVPSISSNFILEDSSKTRNISTRNGTRSQTDFSTENIRSFSENPGEV